MVNMKHENVASDATFITLVLHYEIIYIFILRVAFHDWFRSSN